MIDLDMKLLLPLPWKHELLRDSSNGADQFPSGTEWKREVAIRRHIVQPFKKRIG